MLHPPLHTFLRLNSLREKKNLLAINCNPKYSPITIRALPYILPKTAPNDIIGEKIPFGRGIVILRIKKMNFMIT